MSETTLSSRIARRLTTIAVICCLYGIHVWLGRGGELDQSYWLGILGVAAGVMLGCRAYLGGVPLGKYTRDGVCAARTVGLRTVGAIRPMGQHAKPMAAALFLVTSAMIAGGIGIALVGTQSVDGPSGVVQAATDSGTTTTDMSNYTVDVNSGASVTLREDGWDWSGIAKGGNDFIFSTSSGDTPDSARGHMEGTVNVTSFGIYRKYSIGFGAEVEKNIPEQPNFVGVEFQHSSSGRTLDAVVRNGGTTTKKTVANMSQSENRTYQFYMDPSTGNATFRVYSDQSMTNLENEVVMPYNTSATYSVSYAHTSMDNGGIA